MLKNNKKILYTSESENPSPFLVNLNKFVISPEDEAKEKMSWFKKCRSFFSGKEKKEDLHFFNFKKNKLDRPRNKWGGVKKNIFLVSKKSHDALSVFSSGNFLHNNFEKRGIFGGNKMEEKEYYLKLKRLFFFGSAKIVFTIISSLLFFVLRFSFKIGWIFVFVVRFFILFGLMLLRFVVDLFDFSIVSSGTVKIKFNENTKNKKISTQEKTEKHFYDDVPDHKKNKRSVLKDLFSIDGDHRLLKNNEFVSRLINSSSFSHIDPGYYKRKRGKLRPVLSFVLLLLILVFPFGAIDYYQDINILKGRVLGATDLAVHDMMVAARSMTDMNFSHANQGFVQASNSFLEAQKEIKKIEGLLGVLSTLPNEKLKLASNAELFLSAGRLCAEIGEEFSLAFSVFEDKEKINNKNIINSFYVHSKELNLKMGELKIVLNKIDPKTIPEKYRHDLALLGDKMDIINGGLVEFIDILEKAMVFLGFDIDKRYLLVFQNNTEMRASGGFMGSFAVMDFANGQVVDLEVPGGGTYDTEAGHRFNVVAPKPLHLVNPLWHFWDANWWPDWPKTAQKLEWFYEKSDGSTVDGVIGFTPTVMEEFLKIIGPIDMTDDYGEIFTSENFWEITQKLAEQKQHITLKPKQVIGDLFEKIIEELPQRLDQEKFIALIGLVRDMGEKKHALFYFNDPVLQNKISDLGFDGKIKHSTRDYLMVVNTNIAGQKTDKKIKEEILHRAEVSPDGSVVNTLKIIRTHTGVKGDEFTGVRNVNWLRVYVPEGSELLSASGFDVPPKKYFEYPDPSWTKDKDVFENEEGAVYDQETDTMTYNELGKTVFANWTQVDPGQSIVVELKYRLPFKVEFKNDRNILDRIADIVGPDQKEITSYAFLAQKQPGSIGSKIISELVLPESHNSIWQYPVDSSVNGWVFEDVLDTDKYFAAIVERNF